LYVTTVTFSGTLGQRLGEHDDNPIVNLRFCSQTAMQTLAVFPTELKDLLWDDLHAHFPQTRYLGIFIRE